MSRPSRRVVCDEDTKLELQAMAKSRKQPSGLGLRARIILQCLGNLYERLPLCKPLHVLTDRIGCSSISGLVAACLAAAGPDEIR